MSEKDDARGRIREHLLGRFGQLPSDLGDDGLISLALSEVREVEGIEAILHADHVLVHTKKDELLADAAVLKVV